MNGDHQTDAAGSWQFKPDEHDVHPRKQPADELSKRAPSGQKVTWTASEFVAHEKSFKWYGVLIITTVVVAGLVFLITRDKISTGAVVFVAIILGIAAGNKPRVLTYQLDNDGIKIGQKSYPYHNFKSYAVIDEGAFSSIILLPMQRFMPPLSVYYDPNDEEKIFAMLADRLPLEAHARDMVDRFMSRIRF